MSATATINELFTWANQELANIPGTTVGALNTRQPMRIFGVELGSPKQEFDVRFSGAKLVGFGAHFTVKEKPGSNKVKIKSVVDTIGRPEAGSANWSSDQVKDHLSSIAEHTSGVARASGPRTRAARYEAAQAKLTRAVYVDDLKLAQAAIDDEAKPDKQGISFVGYNSPWRPNAPTVIAAALGRSKMMNLFIANGAQPTKSIPVSYVVKEDGIPSTGYMFGHTTAERIAVSKNHTDVVAVIGGAVTAGKIKKEGPLTKLVCALN